MKRKKNTQLSLFDSISLTGKFEEPFDHVYCYLKEMFVGKVECYACTDYQMYKLRRCFHTFLHSELVPIKYLSYDREKNFVT